MLYISHQDSSTWLWHLLWALGNLFLFLHLTLIPLASAEKFSFLVEEALLLRGMVCFDSLKMKTISGDWNWDLPTDGPSVFSACSHVGSGVKELQKGWELDVLGCWQPCLQVHKFLFYRYTGIWHLHFVCGQILGCTFPVQALSVWGACEFEKRSLCSVSGSSAVQGGHTVWFLLLGPVLEVFIQQTDSFRSGINSSGYIRLIRENTDILN